MAIDSVCQQVRCDGFKNGDKCSNSTNIYLHQLVIGDPDKDFNGTLRRRGWYMSEDGKRHYCGKICRDNAGFAELKEFVDLYRGMIWENFLERMRGRYDGKE